MRHIVLDRFKNGTTSIITMSFDDGSKNDKRLVDIFNKYGIKGTFHLVGSIERLPIEVYKDHEVSCHSVHHDYMNMLSESEMYNEWIESRKILEEYCGDFVTGASYPQGAFNDSIVRAAKMAGIVYSRTTLSTNKFSLPEDFMKWNPTCHFSKAEEIVDRFLLYANSSWGRCLFYIWGHSHELKSEQDWENMDTLCKKLSGNSKVWYATNIEIYSYINAIKQLIISADNSRVYNPTQIDVWISVDGETVMIPKGECVQL